jgi:uncharacterized protein YndB with AHSA1/START domain
MAKKAARKSRTKRTSEKREGSATKKKARAPSARRSIPATKAVPEIGSEAVRKATGYGWEEWFGVLDAAGAHRMAHKDIAALLHGQHGVPEWWCQMVTVGYERARGMRERHQTPRGYQISASRTMAASDAKLFGAWSDERLRARWLPEPITVRKATPNKSIRVTWGDGTNVEVGILHKGPDKCQVAVQHDRLGSAAAAAKMKVFWAERLRRLESIGAPAG